MYSQSVLPADEYKLRLRDRETRVAGYQRTHNRIGLARLGIVFLIAGVAWESFAKHSVSPWWILLPLAAFVALARYHSQILRRQDLAARAVLFYRNGLARIEDRWAGTGESGERFLDPHHEYAGDLDLFGRASLFQLLSTARTRIGEKVLATWLLAPAPGAEIATRQGAIRELRGQLDFREDLAVLGADARVGVHPLELMAWAETLRQIKPSSLLWLARILAVLALAAAVVWATLNSPTPFIVVVMLEGVVAYRLRRPIEEILHGAEHTFHGLTLLAQILARVERHSFESERLQALKRQLSSQQVTASLAIARLRRIVDFSDSRHNFFMRALNIPLMYSVQIAFAAESWRSEFGPSVRPWLQVVGEIEALLSLANYSFEHPDDPFPQLTGKSSSFSAIGLGHPLIPAKNCIRNDVSISAAQPVLLISGSNMSGKSTLLRAIGINTVLAMAGAPVRAASLQIAPLQVGACIRVGDSLQEGSSRFYAEILRLRKIFDLAKGDRPVLFLLDELLQGTNSKDRRAGAEGLVRALLQRGAIGLITTHDLALAEMDTPIGGQMRNVHFQEEFKDGKMLFDYTLREGLVTQSNGLELMRSVGLDV